MVEQRKCGTWHSPIGTDDLTKSNNTFEGTYLDKITGTHYLIERRPTEGGRSAILETTNESLLNTEIGKRTKETIKAFCRTGVHEYGGAPMVARYYSY